jgi:hypothetical protein
MAAEKKATAEEDAETTSHEGKAAFPRVTLSSLSGALS